MRDLLITLTGLQAAFKAGLISYGTYQACRESLITLYHEGGTDGNPETGSHAA